MVKQYLLTQLFAVFTLLLNGISVACAQSAAPLSMSYGPLLQFSAGSRPSDIAVGDFDHDGRPDIAVTERGHDTLAIFRQLPGNTFPAHASAKYFVPTEPASLVSLPLNGYGPSSASPSPPADDLAVGCANAYFYLFDNTSSVPGTLSLVPRPIFLWQNGSSIPLVQPRLITGHFNSANYFDLGYLYDASGPRGLGGMAMLGNSPGTPQPRIHYSTQGANGPNFAPVDFSLADLLSRGQILDALLPSPSTNEIVTITREVPVSYNSPWWLPANAVSFPSFGSRPVSAAAADINGDGGVDLIAAHEGSFNIVVQLHDPAFPNLPLFFLPTRLVYSLPDTPRKILLADLNGDNRPELLVLLADAGLLIYHNTGQSGQGLFDLATGASMVTHSDATYMRLADLNQDGRPDVLVTCRGNDTVDIFYSTSQLPSATRSFADQTVRVYPNPAHNSLQVELPKSAQNCSVKLLDGLGKTVKKWATNPSVLSVADLPRGVYTLTIELPEAPVTRRIILE